MGDEDDVVEIPEKDETDEEVEGEGEEAVEAKKLRDPGEPTQAERAQHELTHLPFRAWCRFCVFGRSQHDHHQRVVRVEDSMDAAVHVISLDYCFMGNNFTKAADNPVLVVFDSRTRAIGAFQVYSKGPVEWAAIEIE